MTQPKPCSSGEHCYNPQCLFFHPETRKLCSLKNKCPVESRCQLIHPPNCKWKESCRTEGCQFAHPPFCRTPSNTTTTSRPPSTSAPDCKWAENCHVQNDQHFVDWAHPASHPKAKAVTKEVPVKLVYTIENNNFPPLQKLDDKQKKKHYDPPPPQTPKIVPVTPDRVDDRKNHTTSQNKQRLNKPDANRPHPKQNKPVNPSKQHLQNVKYQPKNPDSQSAKQPKATENVLYVSNLPYSYENNDLANLFQGLNINSSVVVKNKDGTSKGFGFVEFENESFMTSGLKRDGLIVSQPDGEPRTIKCSPKLSTKPAKAKRTEYGGFFDPTFQAIAQQWGQASPEGAPLFPGPLSGAYPFSDDSSFSQHDFYSYQNSYSSTFQHPFTPFPGYGPYGQQLWSQDNLFQNAPISPIHGYLSSSQPGGTPLV